MKQIPITTMNRYPQYLRVLRSMRNKGLKKIMSRDIAREMDVEATTVRRDFSYLGHLGRQGYGYDVDDIIKSFTTEIGTGQNENVVLIGVGHMGRALLKYNGFVDRTGKITCAFDSSPEHCGEVEGVPVYNIKNLRSKLPGDIKIAIMALPGEYVQSVADDLIALGIKAFINFSDGEIRHRKKIIVQKIDLISMIQEVIYRFKQHY